MWQEVDRIAVPLTNRFRVGSEVGTDRLAVPYSALSVCFPSQRKAERRKRGEIRKAWYKACVAAGLDQIIELDERNSAKRKNTRASCPRFPQDRAPRQHPCWHS